MSPAPSSKQNPQQRRAKTIELRHAVSTAAPESSRVLEIASMFGLGVDPDHTIEIIPRCSLTLRGGEVVFVTGPSGGGKSTILRLIAQACPDAIHFDTSGDSSSNLNNDHHPDDDRAIVDLLGAPLESAMRALSLAGLADAFIMLRRRRELSDGQRHRFALAQMIDKVECIRRSADASSAPEHEPIIILADEFAAPLDRLTAAVIARNLRLWITAAHSVCFVAATTHDDLLGPLAPDTLIYVPLNGAVEIVERSAIEKSSRRRRTQRRGGQ